MFIKSDLYGIYNITIDCAPLPQATVNWFKIYKMPTGKPPNEFAFGGQAKSRVCAQLLVIHVAIVTGVENNTSCLYYAW